MSQNNLTRNTTKSPTIRKLLLTGLILLILVGLFGPGGKQVEAQPAPTPTPVVATGTCQRTSGITYIAPFPSTPENCRGIGIFTPYSPSNPAPATPATLAAGATGTTPKTEADTFRGEINNGCGATFDLSQLVKGCFLWIVYYTYFQLPNLLLILSANFFNAMVSVGINKLAVLTDSGFVSSAWAVVRDLSNIFFILILLYVAIQTILGIGHETKKAVVWVIIMALLINFSMFFTKVVIDSSNILALVFYNKLKVNPGRQKVYDQSAGSTEKDISGEIVEAFNPTKLVDFPTLKKLKTITVLGEKTESKENLPFGLTLGLMIISGSIMFFAAFAFFVAGAAFLGRLLELWALIIFAPFAFMSFALPALQGVEYLGWNAWHKRLIKMSFMAPVFMFFMYLIFMLLKEYSKMKLLTGEGFIPYILSLILPALISMFLLLKAIHFAKAAGGKIAEIASGIGKVVTGLAIGAATGGTMMVGAKVLQGTAGHLGKKVFDSTKMQDWETKGNWAQRRLASMGRTIAGGDDGKGGFAGSSFDIRKGAFGGAFGAVSKITGVNLGGGKYLSTEEGGYMADLKGRDEKRKKRAAGLKTKEGEKEKQELNAAEDAIQALSLESSHELEQLNKKIESARKNASDLNSRDTTDSNKVATREAAISAARAMADTDPAKQNTLASAMAMDVNDPAKVAAKKAANDKLATLKEFKDKIKKATGDVNRVSELEAEAERAEAAALAAITAGASNASELENAAAVAKAALASAKHGGGRSMDQLEDKIIPDLQHKVKEVGEKRIRAFANDIENSFAWPWNKAARRESAHAIRMGVKPKEEKTDVHTPGAEFGRDLAAAALAEAFIGGGRPPEHPPHPPHP